MDVRTLIQSGYYRLKNDYTFKYAAWSLSFEKNLIIRYDNQKCTLESFTGREWHNITLPIRGVVNFDLSMLKMGFPLVEQIRMFKEQLEPLDKDTKEQIEFVG